jgi:Bacterial Ig-like domain (group 3)/Beta-propeller repeat
VISQRSLRTIETRIFAAFTPFTAVLTILVAFAPGQQTDAQRPSAKPSAALPPAAQARIADNYGKLPLSFEANHGQSDPQVKFLSRGSGYSLFLTGDEAVLALPGKSSSGRPWDANPSRAVGQTRVGRGSPRPDSGFVRAGGALRMKLRNASPTAKVTAVDELPGTSNYFVGNDPSKWRTSVPTYAKVKYEQVYPGIDLVYYGNQRQLEYDFIVSPGAVPSKIAFDIRGAERIRRDEHGDLVLKMGQGEIRWRKPTAYQEKDGARQEIAAYYAITDTSHVTFQLANYDTSKTLYIDPLIYSTYLGGSGGVNGMGDGSGIAVDSAGSAYVVGSTQATSFPTMDPLQPANGGSYDAVVSKLNPTGSALIYSTYLGGSGDDIASGIAVDSAGDAYVTGFTHSTNFPTQNPLQPVNGGAGNTSNAFVAEINPAGSALIYSTYLGGTTNDDFGAGIAVDGAGNAFVAGTALSSDFPVTPGAFQTTGSGGFVSEFNATGSALVYSTYLKGGGASGIAVDGADNAYVTGGAGAGFTVTPGAFQTTYGGSDDAFVAKLNSVGSALIYSTYLGGSSNDSGNGIAVDGGGDAYVTGFTQSNNFPTMNALQPAYGGGGDAFVAEINPAGSALVYSTYLGGSNYDDGNGIAIDSLGNTYVNGYTTSTNFPTADPLQPRQGGSGDAFVTKVNTPGSALAYSTYLGGKYGDGGSGIAVDSAGGAYVTGWTASPNFPTVNPLQPANLDVTNAFVAKIAYAETTTGLISSVDPSVSDRQVTFTATVSSPSGGTPTGELTFWNGATRLGKAVLSGMRASINASKLPPGSNRITAVYGGDSNFGGSVSVPVNQFVLEATTTTLSSSLNPSNYGQVVTLTAAVTTALAAPPNGETVTFEQGPTVLGTRTLTGGSTSFTTSSLKVGAAWIRAVYGGDSNFGRSTSNVIKQVVSKATTTTALLSSRNPSGVGQSVTFTASVRPQFSGTVTGEVSFYDGTMLLKSVSLSGGEAEYTTSKLTGGMHTITATYSGSTDFTDSSASRTQTVN